MSTSSINPSTTTRRRFIEIVPLGGIALLAGCGPTPAPAPAPAPAPPAPVAATPAPEAPATAAPAATPAPAAAAPTTLDPASTQAVALGYVVDATKADKVKFSNYAPGQLCSNCAVYQGAADSANAPCPIFGGQLVAAKGWCGSYIKKA